MKTVVKNKIECWKCQIINSTLWLISVKSSVRYEIDFSAYLKKNLSIGSNVTEFSYTLARLSNDLFIEVSTNNDMWFTIPHSSKIEMLVNF